VLAGTTAQATARATCTRGEAGALRWTVLDTSIATVSATGLVSGVTGGRTELIAELPGRAEARDTTGVLIEPPYLIVLSPPTVSLLPRGRGPLNISLVPSPITPPEFPRTLTVQSSDSCVARLDAQEFVVGGRAGTATIRLRLAAAPGIRDSARVTVGVPAAARTFVVSIVDPATGAAADTRALRGRVAVTVNFLYPPTGGQLALRLGGRAASTLLLAAPINPALVGPQRLTLTLDTDARDAAGARRFPAGAQELEAALVVPDLPGLPGCPVIDLGDRDVQQVTLVGG
jgi:hypothetical protein